MRSFNLTLSAPGDSVKCLVDSIEKAKEGDFAAKVTVITNGRSTGRRLKLSVRDYLKSFADTKQTATSPPDGCGWSRVLFNVTFTTFDELIKELWQQNTSQPNRALLSDAAIRYASGLTDGTRTEFGLYRDVTADLYRYVRYKERPKSIRAVLSNFSSREIEAYISQIHNITAKSHIDKVDMLEDLLSNVLPENNILDNGLVNIIVFLPKEINYLQQRFYQALLEENQFPALIVDLPVTSSTQETLDDRNQGLYSSPADDINGKQGYLEIICSEIQKDKLLADLSAGERSSHIFKKKLREKIYKYQDIQTGRLNTTETGQNPFVGGGYSYPIAERDQALSQLPPDQPEGIQRKIISGQNPPLRKTSQLVSTDKALTARQELHKALEWITAKIADGLSPMNCAVVYFDADRYRESVLYETAVLQVDYHICDTLLQRKNLFWELAAGLFRVDKKLILAAEIIQLLSYAFLMDPDKSEFLVAADIVSDMQIDIGSIEYWSYAAKTKVADSKNKCAEKVSSLFDVFKEYLKERDNLDTIVDLSNWLSSLATECYQATVDISLLSTDNSYNCFQKKLLQLRSLALAKGKVAREDMPAILGSIIPSDDLPEIQDAGGIMVAPVEEISYFSFDAVAVLGCTANFLDNKKFINEYKYICDNIYSESRDIRFSYPIYDATGKRKGSLAKLVGCYLKAESLGGISNATWLIEKNNYRVPLMSYGDMIARCFSDVIEQSAEDLQDAALPATLAFSLESFENRSSGSFNGYMGNVGKDILADQSFTYSPTSLEEYLNCPFKYFLHRILKVKGELRRDNSLSPSYGAIGLLIHKILETYVKVLLEILPAENLTPDSLKAILESFYPSQRVQSIDEYLELDEPTGRINVYSNGLLRVITDIEFGQLYQSTDYALFPLVARLKKKWIYRLFAWHNSYIELLADNYKTLAAEWKFSNKKLFDISDSSIPFILSGSIDRVDIDENGSLYIIDYKTGSPDQYQKLKGDNRKLSGFLQLPLYALAYSETSTPVIFYSRYEFLSQPEKNVSLLIDEDLIAELQRCVEVTYDLIHHGIFPQNPGERSQNTFTNCRSCSYAAVCSDAQKSLWPVVREDVAIANYLEM